ncbi:MAG: hypothetical protein IJ797_11150 [Selenomonadaceae bacterium]|nr:hypothetical protein [Selenomonadaceae bacterium]
MFDSGMTNEQFNSQLELLAQLIEKKAKNVEEAAQIVRDAKRVTVEKNKYSSFIDFETENLATPEIHVNKRKK